MKCPRCGSDHIVRYGTIATALGRVQRYCCKACDKRFHPSLKEVPPRPIVEAFLDIEASSLNADFGHVISWAMKRRGGDVKSDLIRHRTLKEERRILRSLLKELDGVDIVYTYYGSKFDVPFLRARCLYHGLEFPEYLSLYHRDVYYLAKRSLKLHSTRLESVARLLGVEGKTRVDPAVWVAASFGDRQALQQILEHNIGDVLVLEQVYERLAPFARPSYRSI